MPTEKPRNPPLRLPVRDYTTPVVGEGFYTEQIDYSSPDYRPIQRGTKYADMVGADRNVIELFPDLFFLKETRNPFTYPYGLRLWATDRQAEDTYNAAVQYIAEAVDFPAFARVYTVRRDSWEAAATLPVRSTLKSLIAVKVIEQGGGYTHANVIIDPQNDAEIEPIIDGDGRIISYVITNAGHDFIEPPTLKIDGDGGGAKAVAILQPKSAVLVSQKKTEFDESNPLRHEYVQITRVYETLPGPVLTTKRIGQENLTPAKYRRLVRNVETDQPVDANYTFPDGLVGDQTQVSLQQETIVKARLQIISEIIATGGDALLGADTSEWGMLTIYENVVTEGTPIDEGFLILKSTVTPFGNGKAVKITVKYPLDLALRRLLDHSLGQPNLTPPKYRRLVRTDTIRQEVDPASFVFPSMLTGDQTEIKYIQETIKRARLETLSEVIATTGDALIGEDGDEYGVLRISETVVVEGSPIDTGFLIKHSTVTPFGNGKAVKITTVYTNAVIVAVKVNNGGTGGANGTHTNGSFVGASGIGGTFTYVISGGVVQDTIVITNGGTGYQGIPAAVMPSAGTGLNTTVFIGCPPLTSRLYDEEMQVHYDQSRQIVMVDTPDSPDEDYVSEETRALDIWRSERVRTKKIPTAVDSTTAIRSTVFRPFKFPGTLDVIIAVESDGFLGFRSTKADLVKHEVRMWWVLSNTIPTIPFDEIITDTITIQGPSRPSTFTDVLHDAWFTIINNTVAFQPYPATTPSFSEYYNGTFSGTVTNHTAISLFDPGSGGYAVGNILTLGGVGGSAQIQITHIQPGGFIATWDVLDEGVGGTYTNPVPASGGSGSGAKFNVIPYQVPNFIPGTAWVGTERIIAASVTPEKEKHLWRVQTQGVIMR